MNINILKQIYTKPQYTYISYVDTDVRCYIDIFKNVKCMFKQLSSKNNIEIRFRANNQNLDNNDYSVLSIEIFERKKSYTIYYTYTIFFNKVVIYKEVEENVK